MSRDRIPPSKRYGAGSASWLTLVAATSLGVAHADTVRTKIKLGHEVAADGGPLRLVVQSYAVRDGEHPAKPEERALQRYTELPGGASLRPLGSVQKVVTADDLARGVSVELVELDNGPREPGARESGLLVAWVERAGRDLDLDGLGARPGPGSVYGLTPSGPAGRGEPISIWLNRRA